MAAPTPEERAPGLWPSSPRAVLSCWTLLHLQHEVLRYCCGCSFHSFKRWPGCHPSAASGCEPRAVRNHCSRQTDLQAGQEANENFITVNWGVQGLAEAYAAFARPASPPGGDPRGTGYHSSEHWQWHPFQSHHHKCKPRHVALILIRDVLPNTESRNGCGSTSNVRQLGNRREQHGASSTLVVAAAVHSIKHTPQKT